jgi:hypothetical protein
MDDPFPLPPGKREQEREQEEHLFERILNGRSQVRRLVSRCAVVQAAVAEMGRRILSGDRDLESAVDLQGLGPEKQDVICRRFGTVIRLFERTLSPDCPSETLQAGYLKTSRTILAIPFLETCWKEFIGLMEMEAEEYEILRPAVVVILEIEADVQRALRELQEANGKLVIAMVRKYSGQGLARESLIQAANAGLMRAVERFDRKRGFKFSTYATWWVRQSIKRAIAEGPRRPDTGSRLLPELTSEDELLSLPPATPWVN